jgi:hypothetical protein
VVVGGGGVELEVGCGVVWVGEGAGCCGGSRTGTPVRECRSGGIMARDWEVGVRIRRRRGLGMLFTLDLEVAGLDAGAELVMMADSLLGQWRFEVFLRKSGSDSAQFSGLMFDGRKWRVEKAVPRIKNRVDNMTG